MRGRRDAVELERREHPATATRERDEARERGAGACGAMYRSHLRCSRTVGAAASVAAMSPVSPSTRPAHPLRLVSVHAHPDDEASKGAGTVARYADGGHPRRAGVLHRRRGRRDPQPGGRHARGACRPRRGARGGVARQRRRDRVRRAVPPRLPRLGHARHRGQRPARQLRQRAARRSGRSAGRDHPPRAATGADHLRRRARVLRAPRPHPGARDLGAGVRRRRRSRPLPRRRRSRGSRRSSTTRASRSGASRRCTTRTSRSARRAPTPSASRELAERAAWRTSTSRRPPPLVDVGDFLAARRRALLAHRTQIDPDSHWMQVSDDLMRETFPWEEYVLARSLVPGLPMPTADEPETRPVRRACRRARAGGRA